jgi:hypothetical protein
MSVIKGSNVSPAIESPIDRMNVNKDAYREERTAFEKRLKAYEDYLKTEEGQAALTLADMERKRIDYRLSLKSWEMNLTPEQAVEERLILTGERRVWTRLLTEPDLLKKELDRLEGRTSEEDKNKPMWRKIPKKIS